METSHPCIGIVGSAGAYGRWLRAFFEQRMGLRVIGHDPLDSASASVEALLDRADVLLFSLPIRDTVALIRDWTARASGREAGRLWLDITSIKAGPVAAMLGSQAEVAGLHPMTAPPKSPTLKGRALAVCRARLRHWAPWLDMLLIALEAECVDVEPEQHDRAMALVQGMVHATRLAEAGVLRQMAGDVSALLPLRTAGFEMDLASAARILSLNPAIYEDIQFGNRYVPEVLRLLAEQFERLAHLVEQGDAAARQTFRDVYLTENRDGFGSQVLQTGNYTFERIGYLLADLADAHTLSVHLSEDRPGSLRELLHLFEARGINIASLHSSRTQAGELHFRFGFDGAVEPSCLQAVATDLLGSGLGRVARSG